MQLAGGQPSMFHRKTLSIALLALALGWTGASAIAKNNLQASEIALTDLPKQGQTTYELIKQGGPFPYEKDGVVFGNRERQLAQQKRGYYREYTVKTPASRDRGALRIVCGGLQPKTPDACFYTSDHYASFKKIVP
jgi:ribonuclease T1